MSTLQLKIDAERCLRAADNLGRYFDFSAQDLVSTVARSTAERLRTNLSQYDRTGKLSNSVFVPPAEKIGQKYINYVTVGGDRAPHARFFFMGTQPSPGRYISVLGRRYSEEYISLHPGRVGYHPGMPEHMGILDDAARFASDTLDRITRYIQMRARDYM